jgi:V/A-type H+-transporting ATPase subunit I
MIAEMTRVELVCLSGVRARVIESLQSKGLLHLDEAPLAVEEAQGFLDRLQLEGAELESFTKLEEAERTLNEIAPLLTLQPGEHDVTSAAKAAAGRADAEIGAAVRGWAETLRKVSRERGTRQDAVEVLNNYKRILEQVSPALGGSGVRLGRGTRALVLQGNVKKIADRLDERLKSEIGPECAFHRNQTSRKQLVGLISFPESKEIEVTRILGQEGVTPVDMRDQGFENASIADVMARIDRTVAEHGKELARLEGEANKASREVGAELLGAKLIVSDRLSRLRVYGQFARSKMVTVFQGWTPADQYAALKQAVEREFPGKVEINKIGFHDVPHAAVPTQLRNPAFFKPFEMVLAIFGPLTYGTIDPTWMLGLSFTIFYGFIVGDFVYGAIIVALALWIKGKWGKTSVGNSIGSIAMYMGVSTMVFGFVYGEYLGGFVGDVVWPKLFGHELHPIFHRAHDTTMLLVLAIFCGVLLIPTSMVLGVREKFKHGHKDHALEQLGLLLALLALVFFVLGYFGVPVFSGSFMHMVDLGMAAVGVVLIFYTMKAMGLIGLIEVLSLGGNIMSYARLMALGIAGIALADMANAMPAMMGYAFGIPAALVIHAANLGLSIASPTIHSLRLNFVEFLPKFYSSEGRDFNPFRKETQW